MGETGWKGKGSAPPDCVNCGACGRFGCVMKNRFRARACTLLTMALTATATACAMPRWPVAGVLTSPYGLRFRGLRPDLHEGVDIAAPEGTPVHAVMSGTVRFAGAHGGYGNVVYLDHGGSTTVYAHLRSIAVTRGARVGNGEVIGEVGRTGSATGPHLHLEVWRSGRSEDPVPLLGGFPARPASR